MDAKTVEFLSIVDCKPEDVADMTEGEIARCRRRAIKKQFDKPPPIFKGGPVLKFGMYRGKQLSEVPKDYLRWIVEQPASSRWFSEVQAEIRKFMEW